MKLLLIAMMISLIGQQSGIIQIFIHHSIWLLLAISFLIIIKNYKNTKAININFIAFVFLIAILSSQSLYILSCGIFYISILIMGDKDRNFLLNLLIISFILYSVIVIPIAIYHEYHEYDVCINYWVKDLDIGIQSRLNVIGVESRCIPNYLYEILPFGDKDNIFGFQRFSGLFSESTIFCYFLSPLVVITFLKKKYLSFLALLIILLYSFSYYFIGITFGIIIYIYLKNKQIIIINRILFLLLLTTFFIFGLYIKDPQRLEDFYFILMGYGNVNYHGNSFSNAISSFDYSFIPFYGLAALKFKNNLKFLVYFMLLNLVMQYWISPYSLLVFNLLIDDIKKTKKAV